MVPFTNNEQLTVER